MSAKQRPRPITVENSWLNKSLEERIAILRHCSPAKAEAISLLVNAALRDEWQDIGHTPTHGEPYAWKCDALQTTTKNAQSNTVIQ